MLTLFTAVVLVTHAFHYSQSAVLPRATQPIQWLNCSDNVPGPLKGTTLPAALPDNLKCGRLDVPLNYSIPFSDDNKISIGFSMVRPANPQGLLNFNPGGPAEETSSFAWQFALNITDQANFTGLEAFDFLAMDPRGTFSSTPYNCSAANLSLSSHIPSTEEEYQAYVSVGSQYFQSCVNLTNPPELIELVGTDQVIQDLDSLRDALGYDRMNFLAWSYGTSEAAAFANKFPEQTGRFVLDAVAPPGLTSFEYVSAQTKDANRLLFRADAFCIFDESCPFHSQGKGSVVSAFSGVLSKADAGTFPNTTADDIRAMTILFYFFGTPNFIAFNKALFAAVNGDASGFNYNAFETPYVTGVLTAIPIICNDQSIDVTTFDGFSNFTAALKADDPNDIRYGQILTIVGICAGWPIHGNFREPRPITVPMLLVGADFDLNTPMETVQTQFNQAPNSTALIRHGDTHVSFTVPSLARDVEIAFLRTGEFPTSSANETLLSVFPPGSTIAPPEDPYSVPSGPVGGDLITT